MFSSWEILQPFLNLKAKVAYKKKKGSILSRDDWIQAKGNQFLKTLSAFCFSNMTYQVKGQRQLFLVFIDFEILWQNIYWAKFFFTRQEIRFWKYFVHWLFIDFLNGKFNFICLYSHIYIRVCVTVAQGDYYMHLYFI